MNARISLAAVALSLFLGCGGNPGGEDGGESGVWKRGTFLSDEQLCSTLTIGKTTLSEAITAFGTPSASTSHADGTAISYEYIEVVVRTGTTTSSQTTQLSFNKESVLRTVTRSGTSTAGPFVLPACLRPDAGG